MPGVGQFHGPVRVAAPLELAGRVGQLDGEGLPQVAALQHVDGPHAVIPGVVVLPFRLAAQPQGEPPPVVHGDGVVPGVGDDGPFGNLPLRERQRDRRAWVLGHGGGRAVRQ